MKKLLCFLLSFAMLFSFSPAFAENSNTLSKSSTSSFTNSNSLEDDIFVDEEGKTFKISRIVTDKYSRVIARNSLNEIVNDYTYFFNTNTLKSNTNNEIIELDRNEIQLDRNEIQLDRNEIQLDKNILSRARENYQYRYTNTYNFTLADYTTVGVVSAIAALNPGVGTAIITSVVTKAVSQGLSAIYCTQDIYSYTANRYYYMKIVTTIYSKSNNSVLAGPWATYRTVREK